MKVKFLVILAGVVLSGFCWGEEEFFTQEISLIPTEEMLDQIVDEKTNDDLFSSLAEVAPLEGVIEEIIPTNLSMDALSENLEDELVQEVPFQQLVDPMPQLVEEEVAMDMKKESDSIAAAPLPIVDSSLKVDLKQLYFGAPIIYTLLLALSIGSLVIWLYNLLLLRYLGQMPESFLSTLRIFLREKRYEEAFAYCNTQDQLLFKMIGAALPMRAHGPEMMLNAMTAEGKRHSSRFWQSVSLLNDIAVIAPMLGLLGTVIGMFYAFYDLNRSKESISALFDGLGISVGTTVGGIFVAILALIFYATLKLRLTKLLTGVEKEATKVTVSIETGESNVHLP